MAEEFCLQNVQNVAMPESCPFRNVAGFEEIAIRK